MRPGGADVLRAWCAALAAAMPVSGAAAAEDALPPLKLPTIEIIGTTPLPGIGLPLRQVPANVQSATGEQMARQHGSNVGGFLEQNLGSVNINDTQNSPFQPDVNFRGFTASPVLGTPQGLSVFMDGVRINEAFGDIVNWDLIPQAAIAGMNIIPGSNPVFGLNTLGGALAITTKDGVQFPGAAARAYGGSFGRKAFEFESGGQAARYDYFVAGNLFDEAGWAEHNPSRVHQLFAKTGYQDGVTDVHFSLTYADTKLEGNQTLPLSFMSNRKQAYTFPDITENNVAFFNLTGSRFLRDDLLLAGNLYYRRLSSSIFNSNINDAFDVTAPAGPGNPPASNAVNDVGESRPGGAVQLTSRRKMAGHDNQLTVGLSYDRGDTRFKQFEQEATIAPDRSTASAAPRALETDLRATTRYYGLYLTDTFSVSDRVDLTFAGRHNRATLELDDQLGTALNGDHRFQRFNLAAGLTYNPRAALTTYLSYNEGMRVPTPVELSCADPNAPCSLPNAFAADPPLKAVVSKTWETGARGKWGSDVHWSAALFRSDLQDDIQFISSGGGVNAGFFQNVGRTRREGLELGVDGKVGALTLSAHYARIDATFETPLILNSPNNSTAQPLSCPSCSEIAVNPGDRLPGIPRHLLKLRAEYDVTAKASVGISLLAQSRQYARGDENNQDSNGPVPGFALWNIDGRYQIERSWEVFGRIDNVFDRRYETFGVLGRNVFTGPDNTFDASGASWRSEQFRAVGAPRGVWIGVAYRFKAAPKN